MKAVFLPASDELLNDKSINNAELVPFKPEFLAPKEDRKPRNWITGCSYEEALERLHGTATVVA
tara:strand:+ start:171 stop:362 length:192 start_codon:yes stop_codon:yes gene_type:complete